MNKQQSAPHLSQRAGKALSRGLFRKPKLMGRLVAVATVTLMALVLLVFNSPVAKDRLNATLADFFGPIVSLSSEIRGFVADELKTFQDKRILQRENQRLRLALQKMKLNQVILKQRNASLQDLQSYLNILDGLPKPLMTVSLNRPLPMTGAEVALLKVKHGRKVPTNAYVLNAFGLMGRITSVGATYAKLLLLSNSQSRVPVGTVTSGYNAILTGRGPDKLPTLEFIHAPLTSSKDLQEGEEIVTSGDGGIFLPILPVGKLKRCDGSWCVIPYYLQELHRQAVMIMPPISLGHTSQDPSRVSEEAAQPNEN